MSKLVGIMGDGAYRFGLPERHTSTSSKWYPEATGRESVRAQRGHTNHDTYKRRSSKESDQINLLQASRYSDTYISSMFGGIGGRSDMI